MVFSSTSFLFYFLPVLFLSYYFAPKQLKNLVMIIGSLVFFAWGEIRFIPVMLLLSLEDYICGRLMEKNRENDKKRRLFMLISVFDFLVSTCGLTLQTLLKMSISSI